MLCARACHHRRRPAERDHAFQALRFCGGSASASASFRSPAPTQPIDLVVSRAIARIRSFFTSFPPCSLAAIAAHLLGAVPGPQCRGRIDSSTSPISRLDQFPPPLDATPQMTMSTFTAHNGSSPKPSDAANGSSDFDRTNPPSAKGEARSAGEVSTGQAEREGWSAGASHDRLPFPGAAAYAEAEQSNKRKRGQSESPRRESRASPPRSEPPSSAHRPPSESRDRDRYGTPRGHYGDDSREDWNQREERNSSYEGPYSAGPISAQSDEQMAEHLRRATSQQDSDGEGYSGQYTPEQRRDGLLQSDPKKRKRNFSNRTKTGCLTCRKRKKKCDEAKPECE